MKNFINLFAAFSLALFIFPAGLASTHPADKPEDNSGAVVCLPDVYLQVPADCLPLGPSEYLTEMARLGMTFPLQPLPANPIDPSLDTLSYKYFKVDPTTGAKFYQSLEDAQAKEGAARVLNPGKTLYVVYSDVQNCGKGICFQLPSGEWMPPEGDLASRVSPPTYHPGLEFQATPGHGFGWILNIESETPVRSQANFLPGNLPLRTLSPYDVVQIYSTQMIDGVKWDMIGPNEWVEGNKIAAVSPNNTPPDGVTNGRWIDVNLAEQTLAVYDNQQMVFATVMASGLGPMWTRPGLFQIYKKKEIETMSGDQGGPDYYYLEGVPWTMYFDKARALHGAYWRAKMGIAQSHGCVNMTIGDAHWLFNWAHENDWVYVHDPSGLTPTDPASYGDGGGS